MDKTVCIQVRTREMNPNGFSKTTLILKSRFQCSFYCGHIDMFMDGMPTKKPNKQQFRRSHCSKPSRR